MMSIDEQKVIWDKNWKGQNNINPQEILNSHFAQEEYYCLKISLMAEKTK